MVPPINIWEKGKVNKEKEREIENWEAHCFFFIFDSQGHFRKFWKVMSFNLIFTLSLDIGFKYKRYKDLGPIFNPVKHNSPNFLKVILKDIIK